MFYHGNWEKECHGLYVTLKMRILSIEHPVLGQIRRIETRGLDYKFTMLDDQILLVEAEETPGLVYALSEPIRDWRILVEFQRV